VAEGILKRVDRIDRAPDLRDLAALLRQRIGPKARS
jgi:hypothetical protein